MSQIPPRFPRALFIAAFAVAGAVSVRLRAPAIPALTPSREERRDRSIRHIARWLGSAIIAAEIADEAFRARGGGVAAPAPAKKKLDVAARAIIESPAVTSLIGKPSDESADDAPWVEVDRGVVACVRIYWRGEVIHGERLARVWVEENGRRRVAAANGETLGSSRSLDMDRFTAAVEAARNALRAAGIPVSSFVDIRRLKIGSLSGGEAFKGAVATIGLARASTLPAKKIATR